MSPLKSYEEWWCYDILQETRRSKPAPLKRVHKRLTRRSMSNIRRKSRIAFVTPAGLPVLARRTAETLGSPEHNRSLVSCGEVAVDHVCQKCRYTTVASRRRDSYSMAGRPLRRRWSTTTRQCIPFGDHSVKSSKNALRLVSGATTGLKRSFNKPFRQGTSESSLHTSFVLVGEEAGKEQKNFRSTHALGVCITVSGQRFAGPVTSDCSGLLAWVQARRRRLKADY